MLRLSGLDELRWKRVALELVTDHDRYRISFPEGDFFLKKLDNIEEVSHPYICRFA